MADKEANIILNDIDLVENQVKNVSEVLGIDTEGNEATSLGISTPTGTSGSIKLTTNAKTAGVAGNIEIVTGNENTSSKGGNISIHSGGAKKDIGTVEIFGASDSKEKRYLRFKTLENNAQYAKAKVDETEALNIVIPDKSNINSQCRLIWTANGLEIIREDLSSAE